MKTTQNQILEKILNSGMIPVFNHADLAICKSVIKACYNGGLRVFEFTNRSENAIDVFFELNQYVKKELPEMIIGIGTITDAKTTQKYINANADFIVSPIMNLEMATECKKSEIIWIPGCMTMTEVVTANQYGASLVKIFPASIVSPKFLQYASEIFPHIKLMPTGGVEPTEENLKQWYKAGASTVGMGGKFFSASMLNQEVYSIIEKNVKNTLAIIQKIKSEL